MKSSLALVSASILFLSLPLKVHAQHSDHGQHNGTQNETDQKSEMEKHSGHSMKHRIPIDPEDCSEMEVWDISQGMCMPLPMEGMPMSMLMVHGNGFLVSQHAEGPRGKSALTSPNMLMLDIGKSVGDAHYLNLDFMGTVERWTFPETGYPEFLQIGEHDASGRPFVDAQHPHNSPIMGLTLSDTMKIGSGKDHLKLFFAPRGQATDGPIAFMHRPTGMVNPDAPLGHHIGQDVGHITSTVLGGSLKLRSTRFELSGFNGTEPEPTKVDLPLGPINSGAVRIIEEFSQSWTAMISAAFVKDPEPDDPTIQWVNRYSASGYFQKKLADGWKFHNALILGRIDNYDKVSNLYSVTEEFLFQGKRPRIWGRFETLQRTPLELQISNISDADKSRWVTATTLGYTHIVSNFEQFEIGIGGSVTKNFLPNELRSAYGGEPWAGKVFVQLSGMNMWEL